MRIARVVALGLAALLSACAPSPASRPAATRLATTFTVPTELPNGRVEITVSASYPLGTALSIPVALVATRGTLSGPLTARVLASGINEGGRPAEVLVRELAVTPVSVSAGRQLVSLSWDTRDERGAIVSPDAYTLVLTVRVEDGGTAAVRSAAATLELR
jgi:hypothetical protein